MMVKCPDCQGKGGFFTNSEDPDRCDRCRGRGHIPAARLTDYELREIEREENL